MKLISPVFSSTAHLISSMCSIPCSLAWLISSSCVSRSRRRFAPIASPFWTITIGSPSSNGRRRRNRKPRYETETTSSAIVPAASIRPVTEKSLCVIPCWTRSPSITSRMRSNGSSDESSRRPTIRVSMNTKKNAIVARITMSISRASREDGDRPVDREQLRLAVVELDCLRTVADVRRVDLELDELDVGAAGGNVAEVEDDPAVAAAFVDRLWVHAVDLHALDPPRVQDEPCVLQVPMRGDVESRRVHETAANARRRVDRERGSGNGCAARRRALSEHVEERDDGKRGNEREQGTPDPGVPAASGEVAVPLQDDLVRLVRHAARFAAVGGFPTESGATLASPRP